MHVRNLDFGILEMGGNNFKIVPVEVAEGAASRMISDGKRSVRQTQGRQKSKELNLEQAAMERTPFRCRKAKPVARPDRPFIDKVLF